MAPLEKMREQHRKSQTLGSAQALINALEYHLAGNECTWQEEECLGWDTSCKNTFVFIDGGPKDNDCVYCPYCGGRIIEK